MPSCAICDGDEVVSRVVAGWPVISCPDCGHSTKTVETTIDYRERALVAPPDPVRLESQRAFLATRSRPDSRVFEFGCAAGDLAAAIRQKSPVARYEGLEISPDRQRAEKVLDRVHQTRATVEGCFDLVIVSHVLEHLEDVLGTARWLAGLLAPGGTLFAEVPNRSGHPLFSFDTNPGHLHAFTVESLARLLGRAGLDIEKISSGQWESARYPDSIRCTAIPRMPPETRTIELREVLGLAPEIPLVVWGAGGITRELILPFVDPAEIAFFVDNDPCLQGTELGGVPVESPTALKAESPVFVLIASLDHEQAIRGALDDVTISGVGSIRQILEKSTDGVRIKGGGVA